MPLDRPRHAGRARGARRPGRHADPRALGKFLDVDLDRDRVVVNPMLTGRFQLAARGEKAPSGHGGRARRSGPRTGGPPADAARLDRAGPTGCPARRRAGASSATATRPRWARSTCCPRAWSGPCPACGAGRDGARRPRPGADARGRGATGSASTRASSRTCSATRRSWPASATPTRTRSCSPRACSRSASGRRSRPRRSTSCTRRCGRRSRRRCELLRQRVPPTFEKQVRDHLAVHNRGGEACPRCGARITQVKAGGFATGVLPGLPALSARRPGQRAGPG